MILGLDHFVKLNEFWMRSMDAVTKCQKKEGGDTRQLIIYFKDPLFLILPFCLPSFHSSSASFLPFFFFLFSSVTNKFKSYLIWCDGRVFSCLWIRHGPFLLAAIPFLVIPPPRQLIHFLLFIFIDRSGAHLSGNQN